MTSIRCLAGTLLLALFPITIVCNLVIVYRWCLHGQRGSFILVVGGVAGLLGFLVLPVPILNRWFWAPILADFGVPYGTGLLLFVVRKVPSVSDGVIMYVNTLF